MCVLWWVSCASEKCEMGETKREACETERSTRTMMGKKKLPPRVGAGAASRVRPALALTFRYVTDVPLYAALQSRGDS